MKNQWIAAIGNFFFIGLGTLYNGRRKALGIALTVGAILLICVEFGIQTATRQYYWFMFVAVFLVNTFWAIDGYNEAKAIKN